MKSLPKNIKPGDILYVTWHDAYQKMSGWNEAANVLKDNACLCFSVGQFLGQNTAGDIMLASSWDLETNPNRAVNGIIGRPLLMVQKVKKLKH